MIELKGFKGKIEIGGVERRFDIKGVSTEEAKVPHHFVVERDGTTKATGLIVDDVNESSGAEMAEFVPGTFKMEEFQVTRGEATHDKEFYDWARKAMGDQVEDHIEATVVEGMAEGPVQAGEVVTAVKEKTQTTIDLAPDGTVISTKEEMVFRLVDGDECRCRKPWAKDMNPVTGMAVCGECGKTVTAKRLCESGGVQMAQIIDI